MGNNVTSVNGGEKKATSTLQGAENLVWQQGSELYGEAHCKLLVRVLEQPGREWGNHRVSKLMRTCGLSAIMSSDNEVSRHSRIDSTASIHAKGSRGGRPALGELGRCDSRRQANDSGLVKGYRCHSCLTI